MLPADPRRVTAVSCSLSRLPGPSPGIPPGLLVRLVSLARLLSPTGLWLVSPTGLWLLPPALLASTCPSGRAVLSLLTGGMAALPSGRPAWLLSSHLAGSLLILPLGGWPLLALVSPAALFSLPPVPIL